MSAMCCCELQVRQPVTIICKMNYFRDVALKKKQKHAERYASVSQASIEFQTANSRVANRHDSVIQAYKIRATPAVVSALINALTLAARFGLNAYMVNFYYIFNISRKYNKSIHY